MMEKNKARQKIRLLMQIFILSSVLNLLMVGLILFLSFHTPLQSCDFPPQVLEGSLDIEKYSSMREWNFEELVEALKSPATQRGALAWLVHKHYFDLEMAVGRKRPSLLALKPKDYVKIYQFARTEKWPMTSEGLVKKLVEEGDKSDPSLLKAIVRTPEFVHLQLLFEQAGFPQSKPVLLRLIYEGGWKELSHFYQEQRKAAFVDVETVAAFLTTYASQGSALARQLLDHNLMKGMTGDLQPLPETKNLRPLFRAQPPAAPPTNVHIVKPGESLWLIAQKYHLTVEELMRYNRLSSTTIQPGTELKIPH